MCPQLGFSFGMYLKHLLCEKFPRVSRGLIIVTAREHGAGGPPLPAGFVVGTRGQGPQLSTLSTCSSSLHFSLMVISVLPGHQSPVALSPLIQLGR